MRDRAAEVIGDTSTDQPIDDPNVPEVLRTRWLTARDERWLETKPPARRYLLERRSGHEWGGFLPLGRVGMIASGGGVGKTGLLISLAIAVVTGGYWLSDGGSLDNSIRASRPGRVCLVLGEEDAAEAHRRLFYVAEGMKLGEEQRTHVLDRLVVVPAAGVDVALTRTVEPHEVAALPETPLVSALIRKLNEAPEEWSLIVLDPLARFAGPDVETDNAAATRFVQVLERIANEVKGNPTVLVAHHNTKSQRKAEGEGGKMDDTGARGASALSDGMRWHAALRHVAHPNPDDASFRDLPELAELAIVKSNYTKRGGAILLQRDRYGLLSVADVHTLDTIEKAEAAAKQAKARKPKAVDRPDNSERTPHDVDVMR